MKKIFSLICLALSLYCIGQAVKKGTQNVASQTIKYTPSSLLTGEQVYWTTPTLSSLNYLNTSSRSGSDDNKTTEGMVAKFRFTEGNRFTFLLYEKANCYGTETETWTETEGKVEFKKDDKGQNVFITTAEKGHCRIVKNGRTTAKSIRESELKRQYSNTYLWERIDFPDDPSRTCLLTVNLDEHPEADVSVPGSIDHAWVTKFYRPVKKQE